MLASQQDMLHAIEHASNGQQPWGLDDFQVVDLGQITYDDLRHFDDLGSWLDFEHGELVDASPEELEAELAHFRGIEFAERASWWLGSGFPPIVIITHPDPWGEEEGEHTEIGDGRGRTNVAIALDLPIPATHLIYKPNHLKKALKKITETFKQETKMSKLRVNAQSESPIPEVALVALSSAYPLVEEAHGAMQTVYENIRTLQDKLELLQDSLENFDEDSIGYVNKGRDETAYKSAIATVNNLIKVVDGLAKVNLEDDMDLLATYIFSAYDLAAEESSVNFV